ncbi:hypothetical protein VNO78_00263 [Psophocarpus tetragonolobus]|uniref:Uncharacterized protein n=1 Tax=Psophocarpus tetragonolobus TaxID=3891 RepID=A0AAN9T079_PSOTE
MREIEKQNIISPFYYLEFYWYSYEVNPISKVGVSSLAKQDRELDTVKRNNGRGRDEDKEWQDRSVLRASKDGKSRGIETKSKKGRSRTIVKRRNAEQLIIYDVMY